MDILLERAEAEIMIKKSRFIGIALPCRSMEEVKPLVNMIRAEHPSATHVVHAAVIGAAGTLWASSDDREPKNTAGRPALEVLKGSGITDICVCIVRYFGGTLLGTGGLVKAYGDSVKAVLENVKTEPLIERTDFTMLLDYEFYTLIKRSFEAHRVEVENEDFGTGITVKGRLPSTEAEKFREDVGNIGQGRIDLRMA